jgi:MinD-like ATPase involved in chromosome partitioning or flagellar assembly
MPIHWKTPSDYATVVASINGGRPVVTAAPRSKIARNLRQLAETLREATQKAHEPARRVGPLRRFMVAAREAQGVR